MLGATYRRSIRPFKLLDVPGRSLGSNPRHIEGILRYPGGCLLHKEVILCLAMNRSQMGSLLHAVGFSPGPIGPITDEITIIGREGPSLGTTQTPGGCYTPEEEEKGA